MAACAVRYRSLGPPLLADPDALAEARAGAAHARASLTWDRAAAEHLALYEELM